MNTYQNGDISVIGNISDSLKIGQWTLFKPDGTMLAKGNSYNGTTREKWTYYDYDGVGRTYLPMDLEKRICS